MRHFMIEMALGACRT